MREESLQSAESYRQNVALIAIKEPQFLLVNLHVWPLDFWKFPQGGVRPGESLEEAAQREFQEELGTNKIRIASKSRITRRYKWEKPLLIDGIEYVGQDQAFFVVEFLGTTADIRIKEDEIRRYCLTEAKSLEKLIKRPQLDFRDYWKTVSSVLSEQGLW